MAEQLIKYGKGGFRFEDWRFIHRQIVRYRIQSVLEYGCGLSTELMVAMGLKVTSLETQPQWAEPYLNDKRFNVVPADYDCYPDFKGRFDLGFIDGPGAAERPERTKAVVHAMKHCRFIYLHDYNLKQFEVLDADPWIRCTEGGNHKSHFYAMRGALIA